MTRRAEKDLRQLADFEQAFRDRLLPLLRACARDGTLLFAVSALHPKSRLARVHTAIADEMFAMASEICELRARQGIDGRCLAASYRAACRSIADRDDHHRLGPRRQARQILTELGEEP